MFFSLFSVQVVGGGGGDGGGAALFLFTSLRNEIFPKRIYLSTFTGKSFLEEKLYPVRVDTIRKASKNGKSAASERYSSFVINISTRKAKPCFLT